MERDKRGAGQEADRGWAGGAWSEPRLSSLSARTSQTAPHTPCHRHQTHALVTRHAAALQDTVQVVCVLTVCVRVCGACKDMSRRWCWTLGMKVSVLLLLMLLDLRAGGEPPRSYARRRTSLRGQHHRTRSNTYRMMAEQAGSSWPENRTRQRKCDVSEQQAARALHIVTARVEHVGVFTSRIKVRRVLKGAGLPHMVIISTCRVSCCSLHRRDTRLFLLGRPEATDIEDVFPQVAPPVPITPKTLGRVRASTRGRELHH